MKDSTNKGLIKLLQLIDYMAIEITDRNLANGITIKDGNHITIKSVNDFPKIFERHYHSYKTQYPGVTAEQFREHEIRRLTEITQTIHKDLIKADKYNIDVLNWTDSYIHFLMQYRGKGLNSKVDAKQIENLFNKMQQGKYIQTTLINFRAALTPEPLPASFLPVKWIDLYRGIKVNAQHVRAFLEATGVKIDGENNSTADFNLCFVGPNGHPIDLQKQRKGAYFDRNVKRFKAMM